MSSCTQCAALFPGAFLIVVYQSQQSVNIAAYPNCRCFRTTLGGAIDISDIVAPFRGRLVALRGVMSYLIRERGLLLMFVEDDEIAQEILLVL